MEGRRPRKALAAAGRPASSQRRARNEWYVAYATRFAKGNRRMRARAWRISRRRLRACGRSRCEERSSARATILPGMAGSSSHRCCEEVGRAIWSARCRAWAKTLPTAPKSDGPLTAPNARECARPRFGAAPTEGLNAIAASRTTARALECGARAGAVASADSRAGRPRAPAARPPHADPPRHAAHRPHSCLLCPAPAPTHPSAEEGRDYRCARDCTLSWRRQRRGAGGLAQAPVKRQRPRHDAGDIAHRPCTRVRSPAPRVARRARMRVRPPTCACTPPAPRAPCAARAHAPARQRMHQTSSTPKCAQPADRPTDRASNTTRGFDRAQHGLWQNRPKVGRNQPTFG